MNKKKSTPKRHFPYKSPKFGTNSRPASKGGWENTVYYWWWAYLKRNDDYIACCKSGGKGKLATLYLDFGDVRGESFKDWWTYKIDEDTRGAYLFAEPSGESSVRILLEGEKAPRATEALTLSLPLNFPKRFLEKRFKEILKTVHTGQRGIQLARTSKAKYTFTGQPNIPALRQGLMVYDALKALEGVKPKMPHWKIAQDLKIIPIDMRVDQTDSIRVAAGKKNVLTAIIGRYKKRVFEAIHLTSTGNFPTIKKMKSSSKKTIKELSSGLKVTKVTFR